MDSGTLLIGRLVFRHHLVWLLMTAALFGTVACDDSAVKVEAGYQVPRVPVGFSVGFAIAPDGNVSLSGALQLVSHIGRFSVKAQFERHAQPTSDELLLVIRLRVGGSVVDEVYRIGSGDEVLVTVDGLTPIRVTNHKVLIDASQSTLRKIEVKNAPPPPAIEAPKAPVSPGKIQLARSILSPDLSIRTMTWSPDGKRVAMRGRPVILETQPSQRFAM